MVKLTCAHNIALLWGVGGYSHNPICYDMVCVRAKKGIKQGIGYLFHVLWYRTVGFSRQVICSSVLFCFYIGRIGGVAALVSRIQSARSVDGMEDWDVREELLPVLPWCSLPFFPSRRRESHTTRSSRSSYVAHGASGCRLAATARRVQYLLVAAQERARPRPGPYARETTVVALPTVSTRLALWTRPTFMCGLLKLLGLT